MCSIDVLHTKVVNYQCKGELIVAMLPKYVRKFYGRIAVDVEVLDESLVGKEAGMWGAIHALPDFDGDFSIVFDGTQVVLGSDIVWDVG